MERSLRVSRALRHATPFNRSFSSYICPQCRHQVIAVARQARASHPALPSRRYASSESNDETFTERLRRKMWKGEPPGLKDPYNVSEPDPTRAAQEAKLRAEEKGIVDDTTEDNLEAGSYVPADTWDGLEQIGGAAGWWEEAWDQVNQFEGLCCVLLKLAIASEIC